MSISQALGRISLVSLLACASYAAEKRDWKEGVLVGKETISADHYQYVLSDGTYRYTIQYAAPIKAPLRHTLKFVLEGERLILVDSDGKERPSHVEQQERLIYDPFLPLKLPPK